MTWSIRLTFGQRFGSSTVCEQSQWSSSPSQLGQAPPARLSRSWNRELMWPTTRHIRVCIMCVGSINTLTSSRRRTLGFRRRARAMAIRSRDESEETGTELWCDTYAFVHRIIESPFHRPQCQSRCHESMRGGNIEGIEINILG